MYSSTIMSAQSAQPQPIYYCYQCNFITACTTGPDNELHCAACNGTYIEQRDNAQLNAATNSTRAQQQTRRIAGVTAPFAHMAPFNPFQMMQTMMQTFIGPMTSGAAQQGDYYLGDMNSLLAQLMQHDGERHYGSAPATQAAINNLTHTTITQAQVDKQAECNICLCEFELNETVTTLPCQHHFHDSCIKNWLKLHSTCCTCRKSIETEQTLQSQPQTQHSRRTYRYSSQQTYTRRVDSSIPHI